MTLLHSDPSFALMAFSCDNLVNLPGLISMCVEFLINFVVTWLIVRFFYFPKGHRRDYYFTFLLLSASIFMMIYLMDDTKMEIGAALGLFAVFGIIRYRTESIPIREMTYLFCIVAIAVVNGTMAHVSLLERLMANLIFLFVVAGLETNFKEKHVGCKYVKYDNVELITPDRRAELVADLEKRLGLKVTNVEVGAVDFLKDMCMLHVYYEDVKARLKPADHMLKIKEDDAFS